MALFSKGIILAQHKEPAFSRGLVRFVNPQSDTQYLDREPVTKPDDLTAQEIVEIARMAQIIDERDGKFLYRKLLHAKDRAVAVIADAVDDEPYVSSKINPLLKMRLEVASGLSLCQKVAGCPKVFIMTYKNIKGLHTRIPGEIEGYQVVRLRGGYPAESHVNQLNLGLGRKLIVGTGALIHLCRAVMENRRQTTVFLTVAGNCVVNQMNLEVSVGMTVTQILERCGVFGDPSRIVSGGPMTGVAVLDTDRTLITPTTKAVLALRDSRADTGYNCIGCGRCEQNCPAGLNPMYIHRFVESNYYPSLKRFDAHLCIQCGVCSYLCPSKLNVAGSAVRAKQYALEHFITASEEAEDLEG